MCASSFLVGADRFIIRKAVALRWEPFNNHFLHICFGKVYGFLDVSIFSFWWEAIKKHLPFLPLPRKKCCHDVHMAIRRVPSLLFWKCKMEMIKNILIFCTSFKKCWQHSLGRRQERFRSLEKWLFFLSLPSLFCENLSQFEMGFLLFRIYFSLRGKWGIWPWSFFVFLSTQIKVCQLHQIKVQ